MATSSYIAGMRLLSWISCDCNEVRDVHSVCMYVYFFTPRSDAKFCDEHICFFLSLCPFTYLENCVAEIHQISVHVDHGHGSVIFWWHCDMLCTSSFLDDVIFLDIGPYHIICIPRQQEHNSLNYCIDSCQILLSDSNWQVHTLWVAH